MIKKLFLILDGYAIITALGVIMLQYSYYHLFTNQNRIEQIILLVLTFFSVLFIYNLDHILDNNKSRDFGKKHYLEWTILIIAVLVNSVILIATDLVFLSVGLPIVALCVIHFLVFHTKKKRVFYPLKEVSVSAITAVAVVYPYYASGLLPFEENQENQFIYAGVGVFLLILQSAWVYSLTRIHEDKQRGIPSVFIWLGFHQAKWLLRTTSVLVFFSTNYILSINIDYVGMIPNYYFYILGLLQIIVATLLKKPEPSQLRFIRIASESTFCVATIIMLLGVVLLKIQVAVAKV